MNPQAAPHPKTVGIRRTGRHAHLKGLVWSEDETHQLVELWKRHMPFDRIARSMGRSRKAVLIKASRLGLTDRQQWDSQVAEKRRSNGKVRPCLSCKRLFFSEGVGNRICPHCKQHPDWDSGNDCVAHG